MRTAPPTRGSLRELAYRESDGLEITLLWERSNDRLTVTVLDTKTSELLTLEAPRERALDVFYHPYFYATPGAVRGIDAPLAA